MIAKDGRGLINAQQLKSALQCYGEPLENEDLRDTESIAGWLRNNESTTGWLRDKESIAGWPRDKDSITGWLGLRTAPVRQWVAP